ncbi:hypothetical protein M409DRAFT_24326 [Zasmidium cellare ATCC 36951]|uniref:Aquaporin n=1 Tax=Zasmidium cellare ATCC 36951 TaxID=1080233 RepID=A0A6A6CJ80_ZASCE|nr:uncharacterized protein M409DRAFT_24326 [Zasmidium cellare ATCC 36951]KAF2165476.1 hypothetical protein M409DRAFT_24326 [Zasmidium cellare ATCC 36951]
MSSFSKTAMHATSSESVMHKPLFGYFEPSNSHQQSELRNHLVAATGEFVGTYMFFLLGFLGHSAAMREDSSSTTAVTNLYIALSYSFSYLVSIQLMYAAPLQWSHDRSLGGPRHAISGGFFNPVVTIALVLCGELPPVRGLIFLPAQFLGAMLAAETVSAIIPGDTHALQTFLQADVHVIQGLFLEMCLTAIFVFAVLMMAADNPKSTPTFSIAIGLTYFATQLAGGVYTGASFNPMRSLAPCIATGDFPPYHWIYWIGPLLGALLASSYYHVIRYFNYWPVETEQSIKPWTNQPQNKTANSFRNKPTGHE